MKLIHGNCLDELFWFPDDSIDSLVTDPPAGISFMGKEWDHHKGGRKQFVSWLQEIFSECHRVLKPGAHALVWAIPRTSHWTMTALEDAGFEIRDVVTHLFGTGFPKSLDVSKAIDKEAGAKREIVGNRVRCDGRVPNKESPIDFKATVFESGHKTGNNFDTAPATDAARQWEGFGTALKPACEFWILCRKPISEKTVAKNVLKWGTGALNIDGCRIGYQSTADEYHRANTTQNHGIWDNCAGSLTRHSNPTGRFPANLVLDEEAAAALDEQSGELTSGSRKAGVRKGLGFHGADGDGGPALIASSGCASRFFYVAKASKSDRGEGNSHPTVKSTKLMAHLVKLVTPPGGKVLDPFMGSGSTGIGVINSGFEFIGIEENKKYFETAEYRLLTF